MSTHVVFFIIVVPVFFHCEKKPAHADVRIPSLSENASWKKFIQISRFFFARLRRAEFFSRFSFQSDHLSEKPLKWEQIRYENFQTNHLSEKPLDRESTVVSTPSPDNMKAKLTAEASQQEDRFLEMGGGDFSPTR